MALSDHPELKKSLTPPLIIHTAATPMPMPKSAVFGDAAQGHESRRASGVSVDPVAAYELKSPVLASPPPADVQCVRGAVRPSSRPRRPGAGDTGLMRSLSLSFPQPSTRSSPHSPWRASSSWNSRRSSWNSIGRAPSLKRRGQSGERRSLLSGEGKESSEEGDSSDEEHSSRAGSFNGSLPHRMESLETKGSFDLQDTLQVPSLYRTSSMHSTRTSASEHQDCNGRTSPGLLLHQLHLDEPHQDGDDGDDEGNMVRKCHVLILGFLTCQSKACPRLRSAQVGAKGIRSHHHHQTRPESPRRSLGSGCSQKWGWCPIKCYRAVSDGS